VAAEPEVVSPEPVAEVYAPAIEKDIEPVVETSAEVHGEPEVRTVEAIAEVAAAEPEHTADEHVRHAVESALAAAAAVGVVPAIAHVLHAEPAHVEEPTSHEAEVAEPAVHSEPIGDAALAEELAAAISRKETEERAKAAADAAASAAMEQVATVAAAPAAGLEVQGLTDNRLADAVARAFESLKPQLITEIIKELSK
jgi:hypothetical protein